MRFRIRKTNVCITFFFAFGMVFLSAWQGGLFALSVFAAVLLHECTHLFCLYACKAPPNNITVGLFGMRLSDESIRLLPYKKELLCTLSAPVVNLFCMLFLLPLVKKNVELLPFCAAHFSLGFFNLLPLRCLDGGRSFFCLLCLFFDVPQAERIMNATEWIFFILFFFFLVFYFFTVRFEPTAFVFLFYLSFLLFFRK